MPDQYGVEYDEEDERPPEVTSFVDAIPGVQAWSWTPNMLLIAALSVLGLGFGVWFLMEYSRARATAIAEAVKNNG